MKRSRRDFFRQGVTGLAAIGTSGLTLHAAARPTEPAADPHDFETFLLESGAQDPRAQDPQTQDPRAQDPQRELVPTAKDIEGPFYRGGAPFRGKATPPLAAGTVLLVRGRVWGHDTKRPLAGALLDVWQADSKGRYDNESEAFRYRTRLHADERGTYEFETIHPGRYGRPGSQRPAHIHYRVVHPGYARLITQLYFRGDPRNAEDRYVKKSLIQDVKTVETDAGSYELVTFDIVLARQA